MDLSERARRLAASLGHTAHRDLSRHSPERSPSPREHHHATAHAGPGPGPHRRSPPPLAPSSRESLLLGGGTSASSSPELVQHAASGGLLDIAEEEPGNVSQVGEDDDDELPQLSSASSSDESPVLGLLTPLEHPHRHARPALVPRPAPHPSAKADDDHCATSTPLDHPDSSAFFHSYLTDSSSSSSSKRQQRAPLSVATKGLQLASLHSELELAAGKASAFVASAQQPLLHDRHAQDAENPLLTALSHGATSLELDVHLIDNELCIGSDTAKLSALRTLDTLFIRPLAELLDTRRHSPASLLQRRRSSTSIFPLSPPSSATAAERAPGQTESERALVLSLNLHTPPSSSPASLLPFVSSALDPLRARARALTTYCPFANALTWGALAVVLSPSASADEQTRTCVDEAKRHHEVQDVFLALDLGELDSATATASAAAAMSATVARSSTAHLIHHTRVVCSDDAAQQAHQLATLERLSANAHALGARLRVELDLSPCFDASSQQAELGSRLRNAGVDYLALAH